MRGQAFSDTVIRLEERHLKELKTEEGLKFSEDPPDLEDDHHQNVLEINQRIKDNQNARYPTLTNVFAGRR